MANPTAVFETSLGTFSAEIYVGEQPITGGSFVTLARTGFYDGLHFHRVVPDFMVLTGCPFSRDPADPRVGSGGAPHGNIPDEFLPTVRISHARGTLGMANKGRPGTGSSQFFVNLADSAYLDWFAGGGHLVFGRILRGMEVVDEIGRVDTDEAGRPLAPVGLLGVKIGDL